MNRLNENYQQIILDWFNTDNSSYFANWLKNNDTPILELFFKYCVSNKYQFERINNNIDWLHQIRIFINNNKSLIYNKFKDYLYRNFNDYYHYNDHIEFDNTVKQEFIKFYKKEIPNMSIIDKDKFLSGNCLQLDEQIYNLLIDSYNLSHFNKWDVIFIIRNLLKKYIKEYKSDIERIQSRAAKKLNKFCKDLINAVKRDLNTFVANIKFTKEKNGSYAFSWEDTNWHGNSRNDAIDII